jgi:hypothetical protein
LRLSRKHSKKFELFYPKSSFWSFFYFGNYLKNNY